MNDTSPHALTTPSIPVRMAIWIYEGMIGFGISFLAAYLHGSLAQSRHALSNRAGLMFFLFVVFGIYFAYFWHRGQTLPMKTWRVRIYAAHTTRAPTQLRALLRYALSWAWFLPPFALSALMGVHSSVQVGLTCTIWILGYALLARWLSEQQFLHDIWAGTQLRLAPPLAPEKG